MQLIFPSSGHAEILGRPIGDLTTRQRIGYLPENPYFYDYLTAEELLDVFRTAVRLPRAGAAGARGDAARSRRYRRRAAAAAAQVLEGHDSARRHRPGAAQRSRSGVPRRADVRSRSARPPRRAAVDPRSARPGSHGLLQLAHPGRRRGAVPPRRGGRRRAAGGLGPALRHPGLRSARLGAGRCQPRPGGAGTAGAVRAPQRRDLSGPLHAGAAARPAARAPAGGSDCDRRRAGVVEPAARHARGFLRPPRRRSGAGARDAEPGKGAGAGR